MSQPQPQPQPPCVCSHLMNHLVQVQLTLNLLLSADEKHCVVLADAHPATGRRHPPLSLPAPHRVALNFVNNDMWPSVEDIMVLLDLVRASVALPPRVSARERCLTMEYCPPVFCSHQFVSPQHGATGAAAATVLQRRQQYFEALAAPRRRVHKDWAASPIGTALKVPDRRVLSQIRSMADVLVGRHLTKDGLSRFLARVSRRGALSPRVLLKHVSRRQSVVAATLASPQHASGDATAEFLVRAGVLSLPTCSLLCMC